MDARSLLVAFCAWIAAVTPGALATSPSAPYEFSAAFEADPDVGRSVDLTVSVLARVPLDAEFHLLVPGWVDVAQDASWRAVADAGRSVAHTWTVTPREPGFWRAGFWLDPDEAPAFGEPVEVGADRHEVGGCCIHVLSRDVGSLAGPLADDVIPPAEADVETSFVVVDERRVEMRVDVTPRAEWMRAEQWSVQFLEGGANEVARAPADATQRFRHTFALADGASWVVAAATGVWVTFEPPARASDGFGRSVACLNHEVVREGDRVFQTRAWSCAADPDGPRLVPGPGVALLVAGALPLAVWRKSPAKA